MARVGRLVSFVRLRMHAISFTMLFLLAACGGSGHGATSSNSVLPAISSPNPTSSIVGQVATNTQPVQVNLTYQLLGATQSSNTTMQSTVQRRLKYISTSTANITITVTPVGGSASVYGPNTCTSGSCAVSFTATPGPTKLAFSLTDIGGTILSRFSTTTIIQPLAINTLAFTANPVVNSASLNLASSTIPAGTAANDLLTVNALDADGNIIVGAGSYVDVNGNPVVLLLNVTNTQAGGRGTVAIQGPLRISAPGQAAIFARYDGNWLDHSTISVTTNSSTINTSSTAVVTTTPAVSQAVGLPASATGLVAARDGNIWTADTSGTIYRITPYGTYSAFSDPAGNADIEGIAVGPDGNLWYASCNTANLGRITLAGLATDFPVTNGIACVHQPDANYVQELATGPDGMLWFATGSTNIAKATPNGAITYYALQANANAVAAGSDGNMWFASATGSTIWKVSISGSVLGTYTIPSASAGVSFMVLGPDGNVWFTEENTDRVGKITPSGAITEYALTGGNTAPTEIAVGPDGNMWYTDSMSSSITRITLTGTQTNYSIPSSYLPQGIITGPDGNIWIADPFTNLISTFVY